MVDYLSVEDVIALHAEVMKRLGLAPSPLRDENALREECLRPQSDAHYERADLVRQAAVLAIGIAQRKPFVAGNYRTAYAAMETFLELNGQSLAEDPSALWDLGTYLERLAQEHERAVATDLFEGRLRRLTGNR